MQNQCSLPWQRRYFSPNLLETSLFSVLRPGGALGSVCGVLIPEQGEGRGAPRGCPCPLQHLPAPGPCPQDPSRGRGHGGWQSSSGGGRAASPGPGSHPRQSQAGLCPHITTVGAPRPWEGAWPRCWPAQLSPSLFCFRFLRGGFWVPQHCGGLRAAWRMAGQRSWLRAEGLASRQSC